MQEQLDLFNADRLPYKPYCSNDKTARFVRPLHVAMGHRYIQPNAPTLQFRIVFDVDRPLDEDDWIGIATPNWSAATPGKGTPHLGYEIDVPVGIGPNHRTAPIRLLAAIEQQYLHALRADIGYAGLVCKNPLHDSWNVMTYRSEPYSLHDLAQYVDLNRFKDRRKTSEWEWYGVGRNYVIFENLRRWAYAHVDWWREQRNRDGWEKAVYDKAWQYNLDKCSNYELRIPERGIYNAGPLQHSEIKAISRSVAKWTWVHYFGKAESDRRFSALQAKRGSGSKLREAMLGRVLELYRQGVPQSEIARQMDISRQNVSNWLRVVKNP